MHIQHRHPEIRPLAHNHEAPLPSPNRAQAKLHTGKTTERSKNGKPPFAPTVAKKKKTKEKQKQPKTQKTNDHVEHWHSIPDFFFSLIVFFNFSCDPFVDSFSDFFCTMIMYKKKLAFLLHWCTLE
jgi:hypothetical protein